MRKYWIKRIICFFLCICLFTGSFAIVPTQKVHSAEFVAGIVGAIGGAPILTALLIGGTVVAGGIAIHELAQSTPEDRANFVNGVKNSFHSFVTEYEKNLIIQSNAQISEHEALQQATTKATEVVNNFSQNALEVPNTTRNELGVIPVRLWKSYCENVNEMIDSGIDPNQGTITPDSIVNSPVGNYTTYNLRDVCMDVNSNNCVSYNDKYFVKRGQFTNNSYGNPINYQTMEYNGETYGSDRYRLFYVIAYPESASSSEYRIYEYICSVDVKRLTGEYLTNTFAYSYYYYFYTPKTNQGIENMVNGMIGVTQFPFFFVNSSSEARSLHQTIAQDYQSYLPVGGGENLSPEYLKLMASILASTQIGKSIQTGRRQLVNNGTDDIQGIFELDKTPVKRSSIADTGAGAYTGSVGWDIPASDVWDDVLTGDKPFPYVGGKTGALEVPDSAVTDTDNPNVIEFPDDTVVDNPADDPDNPDTPDKPIKDIIDEQGGTFSPVAMELTNFFPFCIPFDIYYLFNSLVATPETPTFDVEFAYPQKLKPYLGDSFVYTVDFSDFEVVARILKIMLSLLFIFGLMKITRSIIRG